MKKLTLRLEDLEVEGFSTSPAAKEKGTVIAHSHETCLWTCPGLPSCFDTCGDTCYETCDGYTCNDEYSCERSCDGTCWEWHCPNSGTCP